PAVVDRLVPPPAAMPGQAEDVAVEPGFVAEPAQRLEPERLEVVAAERGGAADQRLGEPRVVVAELVLEPAPAGFGGAVVPVRELLDQALEQPARGGVEPVGVEAGEPQHRVGGRPQRDLPGKRLYLPREQVAGR